MSYMSWASSASALSRVSVVSGAMTPACGHLDSNQRTSPVTPERLLLVLRHLPDRYAFR